MKQATSRRRSRVAAAVLVALTVAFSVAALVTASPGHAQTSCTYPFDNCPSTTSTTPPSTTPFNTTSSTAPGSTTTTTEPSNTSTLVLVLDIDRSTVSVVVRARVCNAISGATVTITFNGVPVASATANQNVVCSAGFALGGGEAGVLAALGPVGHLLASGHLQAQAAPTGVETTFTVPDMSPGPYLVCAQSPGRTVACTNYTVVSSTSVLGTSFSNDGGAAPLVSASDPNSFLAFTGMGLLRLLAFAAVLIALGWYLVRRDERSRRRRRHRRTRAA